MDQQHTEKGQKGHKRKYKKHKKNIRFKRGIKYLLRKLIWLLLKSKSTHTKRSTES